MWARISAKADGVKQHSHALSIYARRYQSTESTVRINDQHERRAYEELLAELGVAESQIVWTPIPNKNGPRVAPSKAAHAADLSGYFTVKSHDGKAASAGFNYVARMLIIAGEFEFL